MTVVAEGYTLGKRVIRALEETDAMPSRLRACVHEYGYAIVNACLRSGVKDPHLIHDLVREIWAGARQPIQRTSSGKAPALDKLDWLLNQAGAEITARQLVRFLYGHNWAVVPLDPTAPMIRASLSEMNDFTIRCTKDEKHRRRLKAALIAGTTASFPHLFTDFKRNNIK